MGDGANEKKYPVESVWVIKPVLLPAGLLVASRLLGVASGRSRAGAEWLFYAGFVGVMTVWIWLERAAFRYELGGKWLMLKQGGVTKQELHIPYGVIQNVVVSRDLFDRVFGLATL